MPLMGKKAQPTPQELYRAKKQRAEEQKDAFLPPGLVNHGNTCFMNSVLQGLIATPMLYDMVLFKLPDSYLPVSPRRSPQLTNGHGQGGQWERKQEDGMPLGYIFVNLMRRAWAIQERRERMSLSPRDVLGKLGEKYDQYLDFRQQDAHELLRHLLDAMRMEEIDIIKKRQPPQIKKKGRLRAGASEAQVIAEEDRLTSFVDMVFGGQLASILVCEKCKKVSCTYEDFNDLSLSIKPEDFARERKRDRLRSLAKKFRVRGLDLSAASITQPRSSSVPASPTRRDPEVEQSFQQILGDVDQRRRSLDAGDEAATLVNEHEHLPEKPVHLGGAETPVLESDASVPKAKGKHGLKEGKDEDEDGWVKLSRRISVGMGLKRGRRKGKSAEPSRERLVPEGEELQDHGQPKATASDAELLKSPDPSITVTSPSPPPLPAFKSPFLRRPSPSRVNNSSPNISASTSPAASPSLKPVDSDHHQQPHRPSSPFSRSKSPRPPKPSKEESTYLRRILADIPSGSGSSSSSSAGAGSGSATPFHAFDGGHGGLAWPKFGGAQSVEECLRMFTSVEVLDGENRVGCRRCWKIQHGLYVPRGRKSGRAARFGRPPGGGGEEENSSEDDSSISSLGGGGEREHEARKDELGDEVGRPKTPASPPLGMKDTSSSTVASPSTSTSLEALSLDLDDVTEAAPDDPTTITVVSPTEADNKVDSTPPATDIPTPPHPPASPAMTVPSISMTRPDSPPTSDFSDLSTTVGCAAAEGDPGPAPAPAHPPPPPGITAEPNPTHDAVPPSPSFDSLRLPTARHVRAPASAESSSPSSDDDSDDDELETETSMTASIRSEGSAVAVARPQAQPSPAPSLPSRPPPASPGPASNAHKPKPAPPPPPSTAPRKKKEVVFRKTYKRYLVRAPPPVLVIHLKRFQQAGKSPLQLQFVSNFRKLDDPVGFPEYLDLSPFLMPERGEGGGAVGTERKMERKHGKHGLGIGGVDEKGEKGEKSEKNETNEKNEKSEKNEAPPERCMYRLYAVVEHIGNMLGGHYVAYTALPDAAVVDTAEPGPGPGPGGPEPKVSPPSSHSHSHSHSSRTTAFERTADPGAPGTHNKTKGPAARKWCHVSDTAVRLAALEEVMKAKAYICMYERI